MARIYISSTYNDLTIERTAVHEALRLLGHDVVAMEDHVASDQRSRERGLADVSLSDIYVGIVAWRYGYIPPDSDPPGLSITELEYRHARALGIPCLLFLIDQDAPWPSRWVDTSKDAVERFRSELVDLHVVRFFFNVDSLVDAVVADVGEALADPGIRSERVRVILTYSSDEFRIAGELTSHLTPLAREGVANFTWMAASGDTSLSDGVTNADVVVLLLSPALAGTGYLESAQFQWLLSRIAAGQPQLVPVLVHPMSLESLPPALVRLTPLPRGGTLAGALNHDTALVDVAEGVRLVCRSVLTRRRRPPRSLGTPVRTRHRLVEVFLESGVPTVTFVEPEQFYDLKLALEQPGRGVLIEGPSGAGKTTALEAARDQLDPEARREFTLLRARDHVDLPRIRDLRSWHRMPVAIDDFHRLDPALQADLVDYLKLLADTEPRDRKLILVGIPGTGRRLVDLAFDIATRITVLRLGYVDTTSVIAMIEKGENALNVDIAYKAEIVRAAAGSLNVAQILCRHAVALAGVRETQLSKSLVDTDLPRVIERAMSIIRPKFEAQICTFAGLDGPHKRICIELLRELARTNEGMLALRPLAQRRPDLATPIEHCVENGVLRAMAEIGFTADSHLHYDDGSATLVADDPQLTFYLRNLDMADLAVQTGKRSEARRTRIFVSYSHQDDGWLKRLKVHLAPLERAGLIDPWADTQIEAGQRWRNEIETALSAAKIAILLVSPDFLTSNFIRDSELPPLMAAAAVDGATILPVVVEPCLYRETPELEPYQSVNSPEEPLSLMDRSAAEQVLVKLARRVLQLAQGADK